MPDAPDSRRALADDDLRALAERLAGEPGRWSHLPDGGETRVYELVWDAPDANAWVIRWSEDADTGFHDHDDSAAAIAVIAGAVREDRLAIGGAPHARTFGPRETFAVEPSAIHRVLHAGVGPALTVHAYSPPLRRTGAYRIGPDGELTRESQPFEVELRGRPCSPEAADDPGDRPARAGGSVRPVYRRTRHDGVDDVVAIEEPLEIRVDGAPLAVTMRTPGDDEELALGFLHGEGLIDGRPGRAAGLTEDLANNIVEVAGPLTRDPSARSFYTTSSCGVCGRGALQEVAVHSSRLPTDPPRPIISRALAADLPNRLTQPTFDRTGGTHATGLFTAGGELLLSREDVGRHNAMDKVIGHELRRGRLPLADRVLCVSGRLSFELVQKAAVAGTPILIGVGAPSSLAIDLADDRGLTLCGFARRGSLNVYTWPARIAD